MWNCFLLSFHCHQSKWLLCCRAVCTCGDLIVRTLLEPLDLLKANIYPDICGLLTIFSCVCWQLASGIYSFACSLWSHHTDCFLQQIYARDDAAALGSLERTLLSLKGSKCQPPHADALSTFSHRKVQVIH